ncbi:hypothetical protein [Nonomuraea sp. NPDC050691]|uniref:hypothetical protein n=1 Tax=Nonomuraea sp. NPDC050691 TaxID=3155661 RepID=UPI0033FF7734
MNTGEGAGQLMKWTRRLGLTGAAVAAAVLSTVSPAQASTNSGWIYNATGGGAAFFDADLNGYPDVEKLTVCDNRSDGRGVIAYVYEYGADDGPWAVEDPSNDGRCAFDNGTRFAEERRLWMDVCDYHYVENRRIVDNCKMWIGYA